LGYKWASGEDVCCTKLPKLHFSGKYFIDIRENKKLGYWSTANKEEIIKGHEIFEII